MARFSLPAAFAALVGASVLVRFAGLSSLMSYNLFGQVLEIMPIKLVIGMLIIIFAGLKLSPVFAALAIPPKYLPLGGLLSRFFGGLSGNQGAFRSAFLIKLGFDKQVFVATGVVSAVIVDSTRLSVYGVSYFNENLEALPSDVVGLVIAATLAAFAGAFIGSRLLKKVTLRAVQAIVATCMMGVGVGQSASNGVTPRGKSAGQKDFGIVGLNSYTNWFEGDPDMGGNYANYDGPCPPWNDSIIHHYYFTVYALDTASLTLPRDFGGPEVLSAIEGHILAQGAYMGTYSMNPDVTA